MLASGRPVVAAAEPGTEVARIVGHCGLLVAPECAAAFAAAVADLCTDDARRCELGAAARRVAEHALGKDTVFDRLSLDLQALAAGPATTPAVPRPAPP
jgi:colanic acid biosynthesis glycosyl transferase WcaI